MQIQELLIMLDFYSRKVYSTRFLYCNTLKDEGNALRAHICIGGHFMGRPGRPNGSFLMVMWWRWWWRCGGGGDVVEVVMVVVEVVVVEVALLNGARSHACCWKDVYTVRR